MMKAVRHRPCALLVAVALPLMGCEGDAHAPPIAWVSEHFEYSKDADETSVCEGVMGELERHRAVIIGFLGLPTQMLREKKIAYRKFSTLADLHDRSSCPDYSKACATGPLIETLLALDGHELVHSYLSPIGRPPDLLIEGIANALSCAGPPPPEGPVVTWQQALAADAQSPVREERMIPYRSGARFVAHLIVRHGVARFIQLYTTVAQNASASTFAETVRRIYGQEVDHLWQESQDPRTRTDCLNVWQCSLPAPPLQHEQIEVPARGCDGSGLHQPVTLTAPSGIDWSRVPDDHWFYVRDCAPGSFATVEVLPLYPNDVMVAEVPASTYVLERALGDRPVTFSFRPPQARERCEDAPLDDQSDRRGMNLTVWNSSPVWYWRLRIAKAIPVYRIDRSEAQLHACQSCDGPCTTLMNSNDRNTIGPDLILRIEPPSIDTGLTQIQLAPAEF